MLNQDQWTSLIRTGAAFLGGVLATKGYVSATDAAVLVTAMITLGSALVTVIPAIWGVMSHSRDAKVAAVLALSPIERREALPAGMLIRAVNADPTNGVKVVADTEPAPQVNSPIIPPIAKP